jgi:hypothetical protein
MKAVLSLWLILMMSASSGQMASLTSIDRDEKKYKCQFA